MNIRALELLVKFGLSRPQARLYLAGLRLGPALLAVLARQAGVKRTTAYYIMAELIRRRYFSKRRVGRRWYYVAATTHDLLQMVKERERLVREFERLSRSAGLSVGLFVRHHPHARATRS